MQNYFHFECIFALGIGKMLSDPLKTSQKNISISSQKNTHHD
jgi:hypothetical protein